MYNCYIIWDTFGLCLTIFYFTCRNLLGVAVKTGSVKLQVKKAENWNKSTFNELYSQLRDKKWMKGTVFNCPSVILLHLKLYNLNRLMNSVACVQYLLPFAKTEGTHKVLVFSRQNRFETNLEITHWMYFCVPWRRTQLWGLWHWWATFRRFLQWGSVWLLSRRRNPCPGS